MDRTQGPNQTPQNTFTEGDPAQGVTPTTVSALWLNGVQAELINIIESAGIVPSSLDNTQVLTGLLAMFRPKNIAQNASFAFGTQNQNQYIELNGGVPAQPDNLMAPPGWYLSGDVDLAGATNTNLINILTSDGGWTQKLNIQTSNQHLTYDFPQWVLYSGSQFSQNGAQGGTSGLLQNKIFTISMEVANLSASAGDINVSCEGLLVGLPSWDMKILEANDLALSPGEVGVVSCIVKATNLTATQSPLIGPSFKVEFPQTGNHEYNFKRFAIYEGIFPLDKLPQWSPSNDVLDKLYNDAWSIAHAGRMQVKGLQVPLSEETATSGDYTGRVFLPFSASGHYGTPQASEIEIVVDANKIYTTTYPSGFSITGNPGPTTVEVVQVTNEGLTIEVTGTHFGGTGGYVATNADLDLTLNWRS